MLFLYGENKNMNNKTIGEKDGDRFRNIGE